MGGGTAEFKRMPHTSWQKAYLPKAQGGLGIKEFAAWNKASITKLMWAIAEKSDNL